jgi:hypothetical protein
MSSKPNSKSQTQTQEIPSEMEFLKKYRCVENRRAKEKGEEKDYIVYDCNAVGITKDNIAQIVEQAFDIAVQHNAVIRIFRIAEVDGQHTVSLTVTRRGYIGFEIRFPVRVAGFQNVLSVRIDEVGTLKQLADKLAELAQNLIL